MQRKSDPEYAFINSFFYGEFPHMTIIMPIHASFIKKTLQKSDVPPSGL